MKSFIFFDFDGTFTCEDVGNSLCRTFNQTTFEKSYALYKTSQIDLSTHQHNVWTDFPLNQAQLRSEAIKHGQLAIGVEQVLQRCIELELAVVIVSCGLRDYIEPILQKTLSQAALNSIQAIHCHEVLYSDEGPVSTLQKNPWSHNGYDIHKGLICESYRKNHQAVCCVAVGNGTSDRSFAGHADQIFATDSLVPWCQKNQIPHTAFTSLLELLNYTPFKSP